MKRATQTLTALALLALVAGAGVAAQSLWVASAGAKLKAEQKALSKTVEALPAGSEVTVLEDAGKWYRVSTAAGAEGWIYRGHVSETPPAEETTGSGGLFGSVAASGIESGAADTSRSVRGLSAETEQYANNAGSPQAARDALDQVTALQITPEELEQFLAQGRIGEYAE